MKKKLLLGVLVLALLLTSCALLAASPTPTAEPEAPLDAGIVKGVYPGKTWQKADTPEQLGWSSEKLTKAREYSDKIGSAAVMIVDDGIVVDAWGDITRKYQCHSMRKSILSALIGIHVEEGNIDMSKTMAELGIDDNEPSLTLEEKQATVSDLIKARSGIYHVALGESAGMKAIRPERHSHAPGTFWYYNNWDFNALGAIFEQETGTKIYEEFDTRIAQPLQMEDFKVADTWYGTGADSIHRYYGCRMSARDLARFGLLFLREGRWRDRQNSVLRIVPADWVRESTASHSKTGPDSGYGYMWWTGVKGGLFPNVQVKEHSYYATGYGGHKIIVLPYRDLVVVHRVDTDRRGQSVGLSQIGTLLWLILDAAGETEIGEAPFFEAANGVRLTGEDLHQAIAGSTLRSATGSGELVVSSFEDGTMRLSVDGTVLDTAKWWTEGGGQAESGTLCVQFTNPDLEGGCYFVVLDGAVIKLFDLDGTLDMTFEYSQDGAKP